MITIEDALTAVNAASVCISSKYDGWISLMWYFNYDGRGPRFVVWVGTWYEEFAFVSEAVAFYNEQ